MLAMSVTRIVYAEERCSMDTRSTGMSEDEPSRAKGYHVGADMVEVSGVRQVSEVGRVLHLGG
jgi:hypothetical protein